jgi:PleD family two-component response regulator
MEPFLISQGPGKGNRLTGLYKLIPFKPLLKECKSTYSSHDSQKTNELLPCLYQLFIPAIWGFLNLSAKMILINSRPIRGKQEYKMEKIMLLDGNTRDLRELSGALSPHFIVLSCGRGNKALEILKVFQPSGMILDPSMPGFDTVNFIQQARFYSKGLPLSVMALSSIFNLVQVSRVFDWGVDLAFSKPFDAPHVAKKMTELIDLRKQKSFLELTKRGF